VSTLSPAGVAEPPKGTPMKLTLEQVGDLRQWSVGAVGSARNVRLPCGRFDIERVEHVATQDSQSRALFAPGPEWDWFRAGTDATWFARLHVPEMARGPMKLDGGEVTKLQAWLRCYDGQTPPQQAKIGDVHYQVCKVKHEPMHSHREREAARHGLGSEWDSFRYASPTETWFARIAPAEPANALPAVETVSTDELIELQGKLRALRTTGPISVTLSTGRQVGINTAPSVDPAPIDAFRITDRAGRTFWGRIRQPGSPVTRTVAIGGEQATTAATKPYIGDMAASERARALAFGDPNFELSADPATWPKMTIRTDHLIAAIADAEQRAAMKAEHQMLADAERRALEAVPAAMAAQPVGPVDGPAPYIGDMGASERMQALLRSHMTPAAITAAIADAEQRAVASAAFAPSGAARLGPMGPICGELLNERRRQVEGEGWTHASDDRQTDGQLAYAATAYVFSAAYQQGVAPKNHEDGPLAWWPFPLQHFRGDDTSRRALVKAGALIIAEIERLDRAAAAQGDPL
jgi:hypothetical protein